MNLNTRLTLFVFFILASPCSFATARESGIRFERITSDNGLSQNTVTSILMDSHGFMWFGTWNGLNRFDGYNFVIYKSGDRQPGLSNNFVYDICEDKNGDLWIATKNGLNRFNYALNSFTWFFQEGSNPHSLSDNRVTAVYCDKSGTIWVGTENGLNRLNPDSLKEGAAGYVKYFHDEGDPESLPDNHINRIFEDSKNNLWIATNNGVARMDGGRKAFSVYRNIPFDDGSLSYNIVSSVFEDRKGNIWIGTHYGLNRLDSQSGNFVRYYFSPYDSRSLSHSSVNDIGEDSAGNLLIGTLGGLNLYNPATDDFTRIRSKPNDDYSLNNEFINSIYCDGQGNVWIGTDKGGVNRYNIFQKKFEYLIHDPIDPNSLSHNTINSLYDEPGILWIGTAGGGLNRYDKRSGRFSVYKFTTDNPDGLNNDFITSILKDANGALWIGTWGGGLNKTISLKGGGVFKKFLPQAGNDNSLCNVYISSLWEDEAGFLLIGTLGGLDMFYPDEERFIHLANNPEWKNHITEVGCILKDRSGNYWIGTRVGLFKVPSSRLTALEDKDIVRFTSVRGDSTSLPGNYVISLYEDRAGNIWVGTYGDGLAKAIASPDGLATFQNYTEEDGLANNVVYAILEDDHGNLWLSSDHGLSRFDIANETFQNYYATDGLQSNQFYWSAAYRNNDGVMFFGGMKGVNFFHPDSIKDIAFLPRPTITDLKVFNTSVNVGPWNNKRALLKQAIHLTDEIKLSHRENVFSLEFSALDYFLPGKVRYKYRMRGVDNDWVQVPATRRFASYTKLKGGEYVFEVKASNSDGVWNENPTRLKITVTPPFYAARWFKISMIFAVIFAAMGLSALRTRTLSRQKKKLEKLVRERTEMIEEQKAQLEVQASQLAETNRQLERRQSLIEGQKQQLELQNKEISEQRDKLIEMNKHVKQANQLKLRFFTNISHEFRTPLTLIIGPVEQLVKNWKGDENVRVTLDLINRNAKRLLHLINQLMDFRKIETGKLELKVRPGDAVRFLENLYMSFVQLAAQKQIDYTFDYEKQAGVQWFDHEKVENIVFNLLSNAFKFTPEKGGISLSVSFSSTPETKEMIIRVKDTGIGISPEHQAHIFKRFYQVDSPEKARLAGTGIGLSLSKELVKAHKGQISVESQPGKGSVFTVRIPCAKEAFDPKEILEEPLYLNGHEISQPLMAEDLLTGEYRPIYDDNGEKETRKPSILVAEDNHDLRNFIAYNLRKEYHVIETENGKEAYEKAQLLNPKLIITDVMMPEMDGLELCSRIKSNLVTSHIPVILLTARSTVENYVQGLETGADDYIAKPFNLTILEARIKNLIESRNKLRSLFMIDGKVKASDIAASSVDEQFLSKAIEVVEEHYSDPEFGVEEFVDKMSVSRSLLHKKLTALTDQSAGDFIASIRLKKAAEALRRKTGNVSEIAYEVGFNDPKYFSRVFKRRFGVSPSDFMQTAAIDGKKE